MHANKKQNKTDNLIQQTMRATNFVLNECEERLLVAFSGDSFDRNTFFFFLSGDWS